MAAEASNYVFRDTMFALCLEKYDGTFASGRQANNKFCADRIPFIPTLRDHVAGDMTELVGDYELDLLVSVPRGGDWIAGDMATRLGLGLVLLDKDEAGDFHYGEGGEEMVEKSNRVGLVDDVRNRDTNLTKTLGLRGIRERAVVSAVILDRNPHYEGQLALERRALVSEEIPEIMPEDHALRAFII